MYIMYIYSNIQAGSLLQRGTKLKDHNWGETYACCRMSSEKGNITSWGWKHVSMLKSQTTDKLYKYQNSILCGVIMSKNGPMQNRYIIINLCLSHGGLEKDINRRLQNG